MESVDDFVDLQDETDEDDSDEEEDSEEDFAHKRSREVDLFLSSSSRRSDVCHQI